MADEEAGGVGDEDAGEEAEEEEDVEEAGEEDIGAVGAIKAHHPADLLRHHRHIDLADIPY